MVQNIKMKKRNLILVRHGQSEWNAKNLFTGWKDPGLTETGLEEAKNAGLLIGSQDISFDLLLFAIHWFSFSLAQEHYWQELVTV